MTSILLPASRASRVKGRILAVEPDSTRARQLRELLREHEGVELQIVDRVSVALQVLSKRTPDVLLTSTFLAPADAESLTSRLKSTPDAAHVQIVNIPYFIDSEDEQRGEGIVLNFLRRRTALARPRCDGQTLRDQIEQYLEQAGTIKKEIEDRDAHDVCRQREAILAARPRDFFTGDVPTVSTSLVPVTAARARQQGFAVPADRRRARRRTASDVPGLWTVKLPGASHVSMVDISSAGILLETTSRLTDGTTIDVQLLGKEMNLSMPARMVRSQVSAVDSLGVRYRVAAAFAHELDFRDLDIPGQTAVTPKVLGDVLSRVLEDLERGMNPRAVQLKFEQEVRRLLPVRDIQIRYTPAIADESIYFTIPYGTDAQPILQAVFEPDYAPTSTEFHLLKAAANLAAVVLQYASA
jgi:CheY-like chemotaxis protein